MKHTKKQLNQFYANMRHLIANKNYNFIVYHHYEKGFPYRLEMSVNGEMLESVPLYGLTAFDAVLACHDLQNNFYVHPYELMQYKPKGKKELFTLNKKRISHELGYAIHDAVNSGELTIKYSNRIAYVSDSEYVDYFEIKLENMLSV